MIFGINTTSDVSKLLYVISRAVRRVKFETILKYHVQIMLLFVYTTTRKRFVIFTCRYFKLSWKTTALSQSNCRKFSCSTIIVVIELCAVQFWSEIIIVIIVIWNWTRARSSDYKIMLKEQANKPICTPLSRRSITIAVNPLLRPRVYLFFRFKNAFESVGGGWKRIYGI